MSIIAQVVVMFKVHEIRQLEVKKQSRITVRVFGLVCWNFSTGTLLIRRPSPPF